MFKDNLPEVTLEDNSNDFSAGSNEPISESKIKNILGKKKFKLKRKKTP